MEAMFTETLSDGTYRELYEDGQISYEELPDGTYRKEKIANVKNNRQRGLLSNARKVTE